MTGLGNYSRLVIEEVGKRLQHLEKINDSAQSNPAAVSTHSKATADHRTAKSSADNFDRKADSNNLGMNADADDFGIKVTRPKDVRAKDWHCLVYTPEMKKNARLEPLRRLKNVEFRFPPAAGFSGGLWRSFGITNSLLTDGCDIYHGLSNELPLNIKSSGVKSIVTIHDVIYRRLPSCYHLPDRLIYDFKYGRSCKNADLIIAVSECTKRDIMQFYNIPEEKIEVIYQGCSDIFRSTPSHSDLVDVRERLRLPQRYIIQVGTIEQRKNLELTIRALNSLNQDVHLVVVGADHHGYLPKMKKLVEECGLGERVHFLGKVIFQDLPLLYNLAEAATYPSRYEGFGIPILEALECNTPVVAATGSCLEEAGGEGAIYVDPDSTRDMAEALNSILTNKDKRLAMIHAGKIHAARFDNARMADKIIETYRSLL